MTRLAIKSMAGLATELMTKLAPTTDPIFSSTIGLATDLVACLAIDLVAGPVTSLTTCSVVRSIVGPVIDPITSLVTGPIACLTTDPITSPTTRMMPV